jgi:RHS repeat-associated protein
MKKSYYNYDVYGKLGRSTVNVNIPYRFTGQEFACPATLFCGNFDMNLHNFRARMYDDSIAMFYAVDPAHSTFSPFGYALQNPVSFVDPTGRVDIYYEQRQAEREAFIRETEELQRMIEWEVGRDLMGQGYDPMDPMGFIGAANVRASEWRVGLEKYGDYMTKNVNGWGKAGFKGYLDKDDAARAAYYNIMKQEGTLKLKTFEYGGLIYKDKGTGKYMLSSEIIRGDENRILTAAFKALALKDGQTIEYGYRQMKDDVWMRREQFGAAAFHTHPNPGCLSNEYGDARWAYEHTSEQTIYVWEVGGYGWKYNYEMYISRGIGFYILSPDPRYY